MHKYVSLSLLKSVELLNDVDTRRRAVTCYPPKIQNEATVQSTLHLLFFIKINLQLVMACRPGTDLYFNLIFKIQAARCLPEDQI